MKIDPMKIKAAKALGDFLLNRGEYDGAIKAYSEGLKLDPTNSDLKSKIRRAQQAKAAEERNVH